MSEEARLSKLLFGAREAIAMYSDVVESTAHKRDAFLDQLVAEIDQYRAERGWSPNGFGGEEHPGGKTE